MIKKDKFITQQKYHYMGIEYFIQKSGTMYQFTVPGVSASGYCCTPEECMNVAVGHILSYLDNKIKPLKKCIKKNC